MLALSDSISKLHLVSASNEKALRRLGISTIQDLLKHYPRDWQDLSELKTISEIRPNEKISFRATVKKVSVKRTRWKKMTITEALLEDETGNVLAVWFNQPYIAWQLRQGQSYYFHGKGKIYLPAGRQVKGLLQLQNPAFELVKEETIHTAGIIPQYDLTEGITQKQLRYWLKQALDGVAQLNDYLPAPLLSGLDYPTLRKAVEDIHFPDNEDDLKLALERLSFDELFLFQLAFSIHKSKLRKLSAPEIKFDQELIKNFIESLPFELTNSQRLASWEILQDLGKPHPMNRLLEGDVGSGKTVVAGIAMLETAQAGLQAVLLAPTEILALQHYETLDNLFSDHKVGILTRTNKNVSGGEIESGEVKIIVGTHALLQEKIKFKNIGLLIVDEQHRFGIKQRHALLRGQKMRIGRGQVADGGGEVKLLYEDFTYKIRGCVFKVKEQLGGGHKESVYSNALADEFENTDLKFEKEKIINIKYNNKKVGVYKPDFVIEDKIIIELKALDFMGSNLKKQIWHYLKGSQYKLALLVNFGPKEVEIERIVYDTARNKGLHESASVPQSSAYIPHLLSMTATPIPRSLALALYGDLDISRLKELPRGRKKIITRLVSPDKREAAYDFLKKEVKKGRQVYVVTPLINESDKLGVKSAAAEAEKLQTEIFPDLRVGLLHGKLKSEEKREVMEKFKQNRLNVLVSTTVIEVGVDVPNATIMVIENAERFGLATLHQLRGRVGRSDMQSYCLLFASDPSETTLDRLRAVVGSTDGFALAEKDLEIRGPGEILGFRQSGFVPFKIARLTDIKLVERAKNEALKILEVDPKLTTSPLLKKKVDILTKNIHLE